MTPKKYWKDLSKDQKNKLVEDCDSTPDYIRQVFVNGRKVSPVKAKKLEKATKGKFPRCYWRPDIFDQAA